MVQTVCEPVVQPIKKVQSDSLTDLGLSGDSVFTFDVPPEVCLMTRLGAINGDLNANFQDWMMADTINAHCPVPRASKLDTLAAAASPTPLQSGMMQAGILATPTDDSWKLLIEDFA